MVSPGRSVVPDMPYKYTFDLKEFVEGFFKTGLKSCEPLLSSAVIAARLK